MVSNEFCLRDFTIKGNYCFAYYLRTLTVI